jgi:hypothetical protein
MSLGEGGSDRMKGDKRACVKKMEPTMKNKTNLSFFNRKLQNKPIFFLWSFVARLRSILQNKAK